MSSRQQPVVYPGNIQEITSTLGTNELIRRLKQLVEALRDIEQEADEALKYKPLAAHLASDFFMQNQSREIRILVACCVADILRIFAPDAPYGDPDLLRSVLIFLIKQLRGLANPADPLFNQCFLLLENLAIVKTLNIVLELDESQEIIVIMFKMMFGILNEEGTADKVQGLMVDVMASILKDSDQMTVRVLDSLLCNLIEPHKTQNRHSYKCARDVISFCSSSIQPFLEVYLLNAISDGKMSESELTEHVFEIIYEIYKIIPQIMTLILGQLEDKIKSSEIKERLETVRLLAKLFTEKDSVVYDECPSLWTLFLSRFQDISTEVRLQCIRSSVDMLVSQPKLRKDITEALVHRCRDPDENVRAQTISMILNASKKDSSAIGEDLLACIKDRALDKKFKVRKEAVLCLGNIYRKVILNTNSTKENLKQVSWIKDKVLHMYYQSTLDDKILCEKILNTCLVPYVLDTEQRMDILYHLYCTLDDHAAKAFNEIMRQHCSIRYIMRSILQCNKQNENEDATESQLKKLKQLSEHFLDPHAVEQLKNFYDLLVDDRYALKLTHFIMGETYTTKKIEEAVKELLIKVGPQTKFSHLHPTVRGLLERTAPLMIDKEAMQYLVQKVRLNLEGKRDEFDADDVTDEQISERGFNLLMVLSSAYPQCFATEETLGTLLTFLREGHSLAADAVIQIFTKVGHQSETEFVNVFSCLLPELKKIAQTGTPKQAKHAIFCITKLWPKQDTVLEEILELVKDEVRLRSAYVQTALATLATIAYLRPSEFHDQLKALVPTLVVKNILLSEESHSNDVNDDTIWVDESEISKEAKAKISAIKFLVRRLLGMKTNEDNHATNTLKLLNRMIETDGNIQSVKMNAADKAHLKIAAACGLLKLLQEKMFNELLQLEQYLTLEYTIIDECPQIREKFAIKLHKALHSLKLPLQFMAAYSLVPLMKSTDSKSTVSFQRQVRESILMNYKRRKEFCRINPTLQSVPSKYVPEYYLSFVIYTLAHHPNFVRYDDYVILRDLRECMWFAIEPMVNRRDNDRANCQFLYKMLQDIKHTRDVDDPDNEEQNMKMWSLCDLGMMLVSYRTHNFVFKNSQLKPVLSKRFFVRPTTGPGVITNTRVYLPPVLLDDEKRSHGKRTKETQATKAERGGNVSDASSSEQPAKKRRAEKKMRDVVDSVAGNKPTPPPRSSKILDSFVHSLRSKIDKKEKSENESDEETSANESGAMKRQQRRKRKVANENNRSADETTKKGAVSRTTRQKAEPESSTDDDDIDTTPKMNGKKRKISENSADNVVTTNTGKNLRSSRPKSGPPADESGDETDSSIVETTPPPTTKRRGRKPTTTTKVASSENNSPSRVLRSSLPKSGK